MKREKDLGSAQRHRGKKRNRLPGCDLDVKYSLLDIKAKEVAKRIQLDLDPIQLTRDLPAERRCGRVIAEVIDEFVMDAKFVEITDDLRRRRLGKDNENIPVSLGLFHDGEHPDLCAPPT